ncbi:MAG: bifunctional phosphoglucose/phosphomannose isomerase [Methanobacteriota archaeon]|nr:MAG: bifunctional phosphoglucose/phosphomannose isomerase [Euryarchaeota archaeon]
MLDDLNAVKSLDTRDLLGMTAHMPEHLIEGFQLGRSAAPDGLEIGRIAVCGLGGSAIGGDLLCAWLSGVSEIPCGVYRSYSIPNHIGRDSLVLAVSYSGNTEETLSMAKQALDRGSGMIAVSSGGQLKDIAAERDIPHCSLPSGLVPRSAIGYMLGCLTGVLDGAGIVKGRADIDDSADVLGRVLSDCGPEIGTDRNPAKRLAHELHGTVPVVIGHDASIPVARRWASQFNENAKMVAFSDELPEMNHNGIVGWISDTLSRGFSMIILEQDQRDSRMSKRIEATKAMVSERMQVFSSSAVGESPLGRMLSQVMVGDYVSLYSAFLRGVDPSTTEPIDELKRIMTNERI